MSWLKDLFRRHYLIDHAEEAIIIIGLFLATMALAFSLAVVLIVVNNW